MDFEKELQKQLDQLPYTKHLDDGHYNDGQLAGFEAGARWAFALSNVVGQSEQFYCESEKNGGKRCCAECKTCKNIPQVLKQ